MKPPTLGQNKRDRWWSAADRVELVISFSFPSRLTRSGGIPFFGENRQNLFWLILFVTRLHNDDFMRFSALFLLLHSSKSVFRQQQSGFSVGRRYEKRIFCAWDFVGLAEVVLRLKASNGARGKSQREDFCGGESLEGLTLMFSRMRGHEASETSLSILNTMAS